MLPPPGRKPDPKRPAVPQQPQAAAPATLPARAPRKPNAMGQALSPAQRKISPQEEAAFAQLELQAGGREELIALIDHANLGKEVDRLVGLLADPSNDARTLAQVVAEAGLSRAKAYTILASAWEARAKFKAGQQIARNLPLVVEHVMTDAIPGERPCRPCGGSGQVEDGRDADNQVKTKTCGGCAGSGFVGFEPDVQVRKLALQMGKMVDTGKSTTTINTLVANNAAGATGGVDFDRLMTHLDEALYAGTRAQQRQGYATAVDGELAKEQ